MIILASDLKANTNGAEEKKSILSTKGEMKVSEIRSKL